MSGGIEFDGEEEYARSYTAAEKQSLLLRIVLSTGLAKTETGANRVLLIIAGLCAFAALFIFSFGSGGSSASNSTHGPAVFTPNATSVPLPPGGIPPP